MISKELNFQNVLWGQSLHFALEEERSRYLNITVHSGNKVDAQIVVPERDIAAEEISKPSLLGYVGSFSSLTFLFC